MNAAQPASSDVTVPQSSDDDDDADADNGVGIPAACAVRAQHDRAAARVPANTRSHPVAAMAGLRDRGG
jgi:hypothetical protein